MFVNVIKKCFSEIMYSELRRCYYGIVGEVRTARKHRQGVNAARDLVEKKQIKLHLGCGTVYKEGWVNVDIRNDDKASPDLVLDLRKPLPLEDNSCSIVHSEHLLEHVPYPYEAERLISEAIRVLQPGGCFSVGVPDLEWSISQYQKNNQEYIDSYFAPWAREDIPSLYRNSAEVINHLFRQNGEHQFLYDEETLMKFLESCGLSNVQRREFDEHRDTHERRVGTMYYDGFVVG